MPFKPTDTKITDFETSFDAVPVGSPEGDIVWADVRIAYLLAGLTPTVIIRVPVPWDARESPAERKSKALRVARGLIDHACCAAGVGAAEAEADSAPADVIPSPLAGIAQELGMAGPTRQP